MRNVFKDKDYQYNVKWICKLLLVLASFLTVAFIGIGGTIKIMDYLILGKIMESAVLIIGVFFSLSLSIIISYTVACWIGLCE